MPSFSGKRFWVLAEVCPLASTFPHGCTLDVFAKLMNRRDVLPWYLYSHQVGQVHLDFRGCLNTTTIHFIIYRTFCHVEVVKSLDRISSKYLDEMLFFARVAIQTKCLLKRHFHQVTNASPSCIEIPTTNPASAMWSIDSSCHSPGKCLCAGSLLILTYGIDPSGNADDGLKSADCLLISGALSKGLSSTTIGTISISTAALDNPEKQPQEAPMLSGSLSEASD